ncbi:unnamed protein product [Albugo candida]|uniref:Uncharacterized protein n=1 Tax=Albugo candida TaxID=65357 RepID=A0A024GPS5_9STRA|nr:unnamed protein product [Albugo candida]|eukprot:CCI48877.1 unnamed protein product [Albugo candida]
MQSRWQNSSSINPFREAPMKRILMLSSSNIASELGAITLRSSFHLTYKNFSVFQEAEGIEYV